MLSSTFKDYEKNYESRLLAYKKDYEDNTETSFLEIELNNYTKYYNSLNKISDFFENNPKQNLKENSRINSILSDLKNFDQSVFDEIVSVGKTQIVSEEDKDEGMLILGTIPPSIDINFEKLDNRITSAKRIIEFISKQLTISKSSNKIAPDLYLKGDLSQGSKEHQPVIPMKEADDVKPETIIIPKKVKASEDSGTSDFTKSTIKEYLEDIVDDIKPSEFQKLLDALYSYFTTDKFPKLERKIMFKRVNKKKVGWALKEVYMNLKTDNLSVEYFRFAKDNINLFEKEEIESINFKKSKFYKYFTTNPSK